MFDPVLVRFVVYLINYQTYNWFQREENSSLREEIPGFPHPFMKPVKTIEAQNYEYIRKIR